MRNLQYEFHLFGARKGKTCVLNRHKFVNGVARVVLAPHQALPVMNVLRHYGAYAKGTPEYDAAVAKEAGNGPDEVQASAEQSSAGEVHGGVQSDGGGSPAPAADERGGAAGAEAAGTGSGAAGDGHEDAGVPKFEDKASHKEPVEPSSVGSEDIKAAMLKLDPQNDEHWVKTGARAGKPRLHAVEQAYGQAGLTADDLEAALPGWNRDKAVEHLLEN